MIEKILKTMRKKKNISQVELSKLTNIPQNTLSQYETGKIQPTYDTINKIAIACGFVIKFVNEDTELTTKNIIRKEI